MVRAITLFLVFCSLMLVPPGLGFAQDATPVSGSIPDPAECQVEPRPTEDLMALWAGFATPPAGDAMASPDSDTPFTGLPAGEPADAETVDAVNATVREVFACFNAGDFRRALSLFSDELVREFGPEPGTSEEDIEGFLAATPVASPESEWLALVRVFDVVVVADGRVAAVVVSIDPTTGSTNELTDLVYFIEQDGQWLVDEVIEGITLPTGSPEATPAT